MLFLKRRQISNTLAIVLLSLCAVTALQGQESTGRSVELEWSEPPYVPEGEDPDTYWADDPLWQAGYLDVTKYDGNGGPVDPGGRQVSTIALQRAINDAHKVDGDPMHLAVFFPPGTYLIDDTLEFYNTECWSYSITQVAIGSTLDSGRPTIRLVEDADGFGDGTSIQSTKPMMHLWNEWWGATPCGGSESRGNNHDDDRGFDTLFGATVRNLHFDCNENAGCVGLRFVGAQWCSLEDVSVDATGAFAGFRNLPSDGSYNVNLSVEGGQYGIYANHGGSATVAGLTLDNQSVNAIHVGGQWDGALAVVGFDIKKAAAPVITTSRSWNAGAGTLVLIDGSIDVQRGRYAIDNSLGRSITLRNVYARGANNVIRSARRTAGRVADEWARVDEYSFCERDASWKWRVEVHAVVDGDFSCGEYSKIEVDADSPPIDLIARHSWTQHPSFEDAGVCSATEFGADGRDAHPDTEALQTAIDSCPSGKVFLPKGEYILDGTITLRRNTQFFGVSRGLTHISAGLHGWNGDPDGPSSESPMITTDEDPDGTATTWLSTMRIGPNEAKMPESKLFLGMIHWKAGRKSIVSGVMFARYGWMFPRDRETQAHTWIRISDTGGGRWYGLSTDGHNWRMTHPDFHAMQVTNTTEPLSIYNFNPESVSGNPAFLFSNVSNLRVYNQKTEGIWSDKWIVIENSDNIGWFGSGASVLDNDAPGYEIVDSTNLLFTNLLPRMGYVAGTVIEHRNAGSDPVTVKHSDSWLYRQTGVSMYKVGELDDSAMNH